MHSKNTTAPAPACTTSTSSNDPAHATTTKILSEKICRGCGYNDCDLDLLHCACSFHAVSQLHMDIINQTTICTLFMRVAVLVHFFQHFCSAVSDTHVFIFLFINATALPANCDVARCQKTIQFMPSL